MRARCYRAHCSLVWRWRSSRPCLEVPPFFHFSGLRGFRCVDVATLWKSIHLTGAPSCRNGFRNGSISHTDVLEVAAPNGLGSQIFRLTGDRIARRPGALMLPRLSRRPVRPGRPVILGPAFSLGRLLSEFANLTVRLRGEYVRGNQSHRNFF